MKILLVHQAPSPFVMRDASLLGQAHDVKTVEFAGVKGLSRRFVPDLLKLWRGVRWCDVTLSWFGKLHALFAVIFSRVLRRRAVVIAGGDEVARCRVGGRAYGTCAHPVKRWVVRWLLRRADSVLAVSRSSWQEAVHNAGADPARMRLVYHGFDGAVLTRDEAVPKRTAVVTVAEITWENYVRKGLELFVRTAARLPDIPFYVVGPDHDGAGVALRKLAPPNVAFLGGRYGADLVDVLGQAAVYAQASEWESFGCAVAEAMLCECIPVVSRLPALEEVVGNSGFYVDRFEPDALAAALSEALLAPPELGRDARRRIEERFPLEKRKQELLSALASLQCHA